MLSIIGSVLSMLGPVIVWGIKLFIKNKEAKEKAVKNYYEFIAQIDKKAATKVANYIASEDALKRVQNQIREGQLQEPDRKDAKKTEAAPYEIPEIEVVESPVKTHGKYLTDSGKAKGLVVHYTAGRFAKGRQSAINTLNYLASQGLGCLVMDIDGKIYRAKSQDFDEIAWHAGKSSHLGHTGISRYCLGMEICNAGLLEDDGKAWFGEAIAKKDQRRIDSKRSNQKPGSYHKYTAAQEKSLINFVLWQLDTNPEFDLDWVVGHDEIAPGRKSDPGGSLSMTMPDFRSMIKKKLEH